VWVLIAAMVLATAFGGYRAFADGRFRGTKRIRRVRGGPETLTAEPRNSDGSTGVLAGSGIAHELGERATMLQFSSAFCAPCRATRRILAEVAEIVPGVVHVEVDAEQHLELVRRLGILRTPTTLILDREGHEVSRAGGAPKKDAVLASLAAAVD
jgi:thiol-disulfide isomerase/thioredoxin